MARKTKTIGLALMVALALSGVAVADELHSGSASGTTYMTLDQHGSNQVDVSSGNFKCTTIGGQGQFSATTATTVTITKVSFTGCTGFGMEAHVDPMGCIYESTGETATTGVLHFVCPTTAGGVTDEITVTPTIGGVAACHVEVAEQAVPLSIANKPATEGGAVPDDIEVTPTATSITYRITYAGEQTKGKCGNAGLFHDGKYTGAVTVTGFEDEAFTKRVGLTYT